MQSRGTLALLAVKRTVVSKTEVHLFQPARQTPVWGIQVQMLIPETPIPPADQPTENVREKRNNGEDQQGRDDQIIHFQGGQADLCGSVQARSRTCRAGSSGDRASRRWWWDATRNDPGIESRACTHPA